MARIRRPTTNRELSFSHQVLPCLQVSTGLAGWDNVPVIQKPALPQI